MKILITGAGSFIGQNLKAELANRGYKEILEIEDCADTQLLESSIEKSDFIFHLQTLYRTEDPAAFDRINVETTKRIVELIGEKEKTVLLLSSTQAETGSDYGKSKLNAEKTVENWMKITGNKTYIFRLANEFGKWCPPRLNSVVATFCDNIASDQDIQVNNPDAPLKLVYIDDIINHFITVMEAGNNSINCEVRPVYEITVGKLAEIILSFHHDRKASNVPNLDNELIKKLYSTYLSYLPVSKFACALDEHADERGSFTELLHFGDFGQVSINISKPGVTKGNHWHHTKTEKFMVVRGTGVIRFRKINEKKVIEYFVSGEKLEAVDIPPGYTHNITNTGQKDMFTLMWANEIFDPDKPDTYFEEV